MSHPRHQTNQTDKTQFEVPLDALWLSNLRNELGYSNSRLQLLATRSFFSHTVMVPEGCVYVSFVGEKWHVSRGIELRMTNSAVLASDVSGLFALKLFCVRLTKTKLSPLNLSKPQIERSVPQCKLSDWGQQANCFAVGFFIPQLLITGWKILLY